MMSPLPLLAFQIFFSVPGVDAPELAAWGPHSVGVRTLEIVNPGQPDVLNQNKPADRRLTIELWYPAVIPPGQEARTQYESLMPGRAPTKRTFMIDGKALRDAAALPDQRFPLVVVSHGYPGSRTFLSYLTENLASKGYVVAAIDHTDSVFGAVKPFPSTLVNRSPDQLFTIAKLSASEANIDATRAAIVGYSMGGYGALTSAGAKFSPSAGIMKMVPEGLLPKGEPAANLRAIVALAPWGAQPPMNTWDAAGLAGIRLPSLFIAGDKDDVSGYELGIKRAYLESVNSQRCLLVYENARHNVGGNPPPPGVALDFQTKESFDEPVWRKDRLNAINQHFITAFLDLHLKGDASRAAYLADAWKGFQKRWSIGLQLQCAAAAGGTAPGMP